MTKKRKKTHFFMNGTLILLPVVLFFLAIVLGRFPVDPFTVGKVLLHPFIVIKQTWPDTLNALILDVRLPRVLSAMLIGAALSLAGCCYQGVFRNPLVSPFTLGVSSGAGFGAALAILFFSSLWAVPISAFTFAFISVLGSFAISRMYQGNSTLLLLLGGIIIGAIFTALLSLLKYVADPYSKLPVIEYWLLGSLASINNKDVFMLCVVTLPPTFLTWLMRWRLNILALGDDHAKSLGINPSYYRFFYVICATLIAAAAVSVSGIIGWVGLMVPHLARILVGPDFSRLIPASISLGACYLLIVDTIARTISASEIPLGILTALIGAPIFLILLRRKTLGWSL